MRTGHSTKTFRSAGLVVALAVQSLTAAACADEADRSRDALSDAPTTSPDDQASASSDSPATTTTEAPTTTTTTTTIPVVSSGTYVVPDQFSPGTYRVEGYWARLDANQEIIDNDIVDSGLTLMNVTDTDAYIEISGSAVALVDMPEADPIAEGWTDGTYLVGTDLPAGQYNLTPAGSSAYYARLDADRGIIDNNISDGNVIAVAQPDDWALTYTGTIEAMP